jgi:hypothetical protein
MMPGEKFAWHAKIGDISQIFIYNLYQNAFGEISLLVQFYGKFREIN